MTLAARMSKYLKLKYIKVTRTLSVKCVFKKVSQIPVLIVQKLFTSVFFGLVKNFVLLCKLCQSLCCLDIWGGGWVVL